MAQYLSQILVHGDERSVWHGEVGREARTGQIDLRPFRPAPFANGTQAVGLG